MQYLCLAYHDEKKFEALSKAELDTIGIKCNCHDEELHKGGHLILVGSLAATRTTTHVRPKNGKVSITDGPYAESKEQVGAFFIIEAKDVNEAILVASKHPAAHLNEHLGWGIEVRPIDFSSSRSRGSATDGRGVGRTCVRVGGRRLPRRVSLRPCHSDPPAGRLRPRRGGAARGLQGRAGAVAA
jgi:hypothetical protein